jgi:hypothetical protein
VTANGFELFELKVAEFLVYTAPNKLLESEGKVTVTKLLELVKVPLRVQSMV